VVAELACATTLLVAAGLLLESTLRLDRADPGFDADHVLSVRLALNGERYSPAERRMLLRRLEERLGRPPGVAAARFVGTAPLAAERTEEPFPLDPRPAGGREIREATSVAAGDRRSRDREATSVATGDRRSRDLAAEWRVVTPGCFRALGLRRIAGRLL